MAEARQLSCFTRVYLFGAILRRRRSIWKRLLCLLLDQCARVLVYRFSHGRCDALDGADQMRRCWGLYGDGVECMAVDSFACVGDCFG